MARNDPEVEFGTVVYDEDGERLGTVRGFDEGGFYVAGDDQVDLRGLEAAGGGEHGRAAMWRCWECGEMGRIDEAFPDHCPACEAPREEIYYWTED